MRVTFVSHDGGEVTVASDTDDWQRAIDKWGREHGFTPPVQRTWHSEKMGCDVVDFGSHTEFFHIYDE